MELDYYISLANIPDSLVFYKVLYGTSFDFSSNLNVNSYLDDSMDEDRSSYTCFFTFEKRRHHSQILLSNYSALDYLGNTSKSGYTIGVNNTNELFVDYPRGNFSKTFDIRLGNKNCIAIKKSGNIITVYKYDIISGIIEDSDSIYIEESNINYIDNGHFTIGGNIDYLALSQNNSSINYFSGYFDQFVFISAALDESLINIVFKGFRPETFSQTITTSFSKSESYRWIDPALESYKSALTSGFNTIDQYLLTGFSSTGRYIAIETGKFGYSTNFDIKNVYYTGDFCDTGVRVYPGSVAEDYTGIVPSGATSYTYSGWTNINKLSGRMVVSRAVTLTLSGTGYRFDYDSAYYSQGVSTGYSSSFDYSYYSGLKMDGVFSDRQNLSYLYSGKLREPSGYHRIGQYDFVRGAFYIPEYSATGSFYLNGQPEIGGVITGNFIYINGTSSTDSLIYDNTNNYTPLNGGDSNYLSGGYYQNSSRVLNSTDFANLLLNVEYYETATGHMYHNNLYQPSGEKLIFVV